MQDVHLGLLVALLPALAGHRGGAPAKSNNGVVHGILNGLDNGSGSGNLCLSTKHRMCLPLMLLIFRQ